MHLDCNAKRRSETRALLNNHKITAKEEFRNHCEIHYHLINDEIFKVESMKDHAFNPDILR